MIKSPLLALAALTLVAGCRADGASPVRHPEGEYERLHGADLARARALYDEGEGERGAAILRALATDESWEVRARTVRVIGEVKDDGLLPEVHAALKDENLEVRESAGRVLQWLGDESSIGPLVEALEDPEPVIRIRAVEGLERIGGASQLGTLREVAESDEDPSVRAAAREAVSRLE